MVDLIAIQLVDEQTRIGIEANGNCRDDIIEIARGERQALGLHAIDASDAVSSPRISATNEQPGRLPMPLAVDHPDLEESLTVGELRLQCVALLDTERAQRCRLWQAYDRVAEGAWRRVSASSRRLDGLSASPCHLLLPRVSEKEQRFALDDDLEV